MDTSEFKDIQKEFRSLAKILARFGELKGQKADFTDELEKALSKIPDGATLGRAVEELKARAERVLSGVRSERRAAFGATVTAFLKGARERGVGTRDLGNSWRIGPLMLELQPEQGRGRVLYNHDVVVPWSRVGAPEDLEALERQGMEKLERAALAPEDLPDIVAAAFRRAEGETATGGSRQSGLVPVMSLLKELRLELARRELASGSPGKKLRTADFPLWALLYNLDRYRTLGESTSGHQRVAFQTGSQAEVAKGHGVTLNGLTAEQEYKVFCYAIPGR